MGDGRKKKKERKKGSSGGSSISERLKVDLIFTLRQISVKDDTRVRGVPPPHPTPSFARAKVTKKGDAPSRLRRHKGQRFSAWRRR